MKRRRIKRRRPATLPRFPKPRGLRPGHDLGDARREAARRRCRRRIRREEID